MQRLAGYGKRNSQHRCECSVFSRQWSVNRCVMSPRDGIRLCRSPDDVQMSEPRGRFLVNCSHFSRSARTAIRHGSKRGLKLAVGARVWPTRRADALPLALRVFMRIIRCPDSSWREWSEVHPLVQIGLRLTADAGLLRRSFQPIDLFQEGSQEGFDVGHNGHRLE